MKINYLKLRERKKLKDLDWGTFFVTDDMVYRKTSYVSSKEGRLDITDVCVDISEENRPAQVIICQRDNKFYGVNREHFVEVAYFELNEISKESSE
jgi:hypothetical protein